MPLPNYLIFNTSLDPGVPRIGRLFPGCHGGDGGQEPGGVGEPLFGPTPFVAVSFYPGA